ncbi:alpha/beta hydrolase [Singulisphaera sp. Ch08]|uniref:Alpha/beta hydrolase n=1 Tax=Singulisphaera sp. Ch08 TaxID=3120278 RepID=A0AAU7CAF2_9BACT
MLASLIRHVLPLVLLTSSLAFAAESPKVGSADQGEPSSHSNIVKLENLVYGQVQGAGLLADVAYPKSTELIPAIISVHGGRWFRGDKRDASAIKVEQWAEFGFFAIAIDYRLLGCTPAPACYQDVQCAIRFVHANAEKYHIDPHRIFLIGQSAGGHMASLAATLGDGPFPRTGGWEKASNKVRAVISVSGNYDLSSGGWGDLWKPVGDDLAGARVLASPVNHVSQKMTPLMIIHSDDDKSVPIAVGLRMGEALKRVGAPHVFHHYSKAGHMSINDEVIKQARAFIEAQSKVSD